MTATYMQETSDEEVSSQRHDVSSDEEHAEVLQLQVPGGEQLQDGCSIRGVLCLTSQLLQRCYQDHHPFSWKYSREHISL